MLSDLINPTTNPTPAAPSALASFARRVLVAFSVVLVLGLGGVVLARTAGGSKQAEPVVVFVLRGQPVVVAPAAVEAKSNNNAELLRDADDDDAAEPRLASYLPEKTEVKVELAKPSAPRGKSPAVELPGAKRTTTMLMEVTAYCPCTKCCGPKAQGLTASGKPVSYNGGRFVAADTKKLKFGTKLLIPGYADGEAVEVIDRGGAIKGDKLDVFFPTHQEALVWGRKKIAVLVED